MLQLSLFTKRVIDMVVVPYHTTSRTNIWSFLTTVRLGKAEVFFLPTHATYRKRSNLKNNRCLLLQPWADLTRQ